MTIQQFDSLANDLEMRCTTPQQRGKLRQVVAYFHNRPAVPPLRGSVPAAAPREPEDREAAAAGRQFRLRPKAVSSLTIQATLSLWADFPAWIGILEFLRRWSATMEQSLKSEEPGKVHLHVFTEFGQAVDWTSLRCVVFMGVRPDAAPCSPWPSSSPSFEPQPLLCPCQQGWHAESGDFWLHSLRGLSCQELVVGQPLDGAQAFA